MNALITLYRKLIPERIRYLVLEIRKSRKLHRVKKMVLDYYNDHPAYDPEINEALAYLKKNDLSVFPYPFSKKYSAKSINVILDENNGLFYVYYNSKKLYFKRGLTVKQIREAYAFLLCEQDPESPHRYLGGTFKYFKKETTLADVGCAEGLFSLMNIENIKMAYLFEADSDWHEALEITFRPWKEKVTLINKFVSDKTEGNKLSLDDYFNDRPLDFLKIDVDGAETSLLNGAGRLLGRSHLQVCLCTYHNADDADNFKLLLKGLHYKTEFSQKYMLFYFDPRFNAPYFRKGLIRAYK